MVSQLERNPSRTRVNLRKALKTNPDEVEPHQDVVVLDTVNSTDSEFLFALRLIGKGFA